MLNRYDADNLMLKYIWMLIDLSLNWSVDYFSKMPAKLLSGNDFDNHVYINKQ